MTKARTICLVACLLVLGCGEVHVKAGVYVTVQAGDNNTVEVDSLGEKEFKP